MTELFHTSPKMIEKIAKGRFDGLLFFSAHEYHMSKVKAVYQIDVDESDLIDVNSLFYHEDADKLSNIVAEFAASNEIDEDVAENLISERQSAFDLDVEDPSDLSWDAQKVAGRCAKALGYRGCFGQDEQGRYYLIDMLGRESELKIAKIYE